MEGSATGYRKSVSYTTRHPEREPWIQRGEDERNIQRFHKEPKVPEDSRKFYSPFHWRAGRVTDHYPLGLLQLQLLSDAIHPQGEVVIIVHFRLDTTNGVDDGGVIPAAKAPADLDE